MIRPVIQAPDPRLLQPSAEIRLFIDSLPDTLIGDLIDTRLKHKAAALCAVQIGYPLRVIAIDPSYTGGYRILINPKISWRRPGDVTGEEGSMSIGDGIPRFKVKRSPSVTVEFETKGALDVTMTLDGFGARVVQHCVDQLDGKMIA